MTEPLKVFSSPQGFSEFSASYKSVLQKWPCTFEEIYVPTGFGETHVIASGPQDAPPIVFLHAFFATAAVWYPNAGGLSNKYRTYAVDILGEANLSRPTLPIKSMDEMAAWFGEILAGLGVEKTFVVGNSFGAFLGANLAMRMPDKIKGLVLIGPAATFNKITPFYTHMFLPKMLQMIFPWLPGIQALIRNGIDWMHAGLPRDEAWQELFFKTMLYGGVTNQVFPRVNTKEELETIKVPTLLLLGDRERIYDIHKTIGIAKSAVPGLQAEIIPDAHHITALAQPEIVNKRIDSYFSSITG